MFDFAVEIHLNAELSGRDGSDLVGQSCLVWSMPASSNLTGVEKILPIIEAVKRKVRRLLKPVPSFPQLRNFSPNFASETFVIRIETDNRELYQAWIEVKDFVYGLKPFQDTNLAAALQPNMRGGITYTCESR
jgi:hypothetical protein